MKPRHSAPGVRHSTFDGRHSETAGRHLASGIRHAIGAAIVATALTYLHGADGQNRKSPVVQFPAGLVRIDAIVERELTSAGAVPPLTKDDFDIKIDGQSQPVDYFSSDPAPLSLALLVDVSDSLTLASSPREFQGAMADFAALGVGLMDRGRIGAIADTLYWTSPLTPDKVALAKAANEVFDIGPQHGGGPSPIWDSIDVASRMLAAESVWRRRALIVITDGQATGNARGSADVANDAAAAGVSVTTITERALTSIITYGGGSDPSKALRVMAETTGGEPYVDGFAPAPRDPARFVRSAIDALRHAYTLGFTPAAADGKIHTIDVTVKRAGLMARARRLYKGV